MSIADMAVASIHGWLDTFDKCRGQVEHVKAMIDADIEENGAPPCEFHPGYKDETTGLEVKAHFYDPIQAYKDRLDEATRLLNQAEVIICEVVAAI